MAAPDVDHYELLGVDMSADEKALKSAYRKMALKLHPDKNPDNPNAAEVFDQLKKSFDFLKDPEERERYDRKIRARRAAKERYKEMDLKRKSMRDALEAREQQGRSDRQRDPASVFSFQAASGGDGGAAKRRKTEINRIREAELVRASEFQEKLRAKTAAAAVTAATATAGRDKDRAAANGHSRGARPGGTGHDEGQHRHERSNRLKIKWKQKSKGAACWSQRHVRGIMSAYGTVESVVVGGGVAIIEFASACGAKAAALDKKRLKDMGLNRVVHMAAAAGGGDSDPTELTEAGGSSTGIATQPPGRAQSGPQSGPATRPHFSVDEASSASCVPSPADGPTLTGRPSQNRTARPIATPAATAAALPMPTGSGGGRERGRSFNSYEGDTLAMLMKLAAEKKKG